MAIKHIPTSKSAIILPITSAPFGPLASSATKEFKGRINTQDIVKKITSIAKAEKNLPRTICVVETGAVKSNCSVFVLFSSLKDFIVRIGINTIKMKIKPEKYTDVSAVCEKIVETEKIIAEITSALAKNM